MRRSGVRALCRHPRDRPWRARSKASPAKSRPRASRHGHRIPNWKTPPPHNPRAPPSSAANAAGYPMNICISIAHETVYAPFSRSPFNLLNRRLIKNFRPAKAAAAAVKGRPFVSPRTVDVAGSSSSSSLSRPSVKGRRGACARVYILYSRHIHGRPTVLEALFDGHREWGGWPIESTLYHALAKRKKQFTDNDS